MSNDIDTPHPFDFLFSLHSAFLYSYSIYLLVTATNYTI